MDFWSSSTNEMDNNASHSKDGSSSNPSEFVNHGLLLWNQTRQQWVGDKDSKKPKQVQESDLWWNSTYDSLLGTTQSFPKPIPLRVSLLSGLLRSDSRV